MTQPAGQFESFVMANSIRNIFGFPTVEFVLHSNAPNDGATRSSAKSASVNGEKGHEKEQPITPPERQASAKTSMAAGSPHGKKKDDSDSKHLKQKRKPSRTVNRKSSKSSPNHVGESRPTKHHSRLWEGRKRSEGGFPQRFQLRLRELQPSLGIREMLFVGHRIRSQQHLNVFIALVVLRIE